MIFDDHNTPDLLKSLEGEVAKTIAEVRSIEETTEKVKNRQKFILALVHYLKDRI